MGFEFTTYEGSKFSEEAQEHATRSDTFEQLTFGWIGDERSVLCLGGTGDPDDHPATFIVLRCGEEEIGHIEIDLRAFRDFFPDVPLADAIKNSAKPESAVWCEPIANYSIAPADALKIAASYLLTNKAEVSLALEGREQMEELRSDDEEGALLGKEIIWVMPQYLDRESGKGFGEYRAVVRDIAFQDREGQDREGLGLAV